MLLGFLALTSVLQAPDTQVRLDYERGANAAQCPTAQIVQRSVAAQLGYDPFHVASRKTIRVRVEGSGTALTAEIQIVENGEVIGLRSLSSVGEDCSELAESLALAIGIAIDPMSSMSHGALQPASPTIREPVRPPEPLESAEPKPWRFRLGAGVLGSAGTSPRVTGGANLRIEMWRDQLSMGLEGRADIPTSVDRSGGRVSASLLAAGATVCWQHRVFAGCGVGWAGAIRGSGHELEKAKVVTTPFVGLGGRFQVAFDLSDTLALRAYADVLGSLVSTTLRVGGKDVWRSPVGAVSLGAVFTAELS